MAQQELWSTLTNDTTREIRKWASVWMDVLHADMVLYERQQLPKKPSTAFQRRALWESAVVAYGRVPMSMHRRKVSFTEFLQEVCGDAGLATHERIMDWRHGHVAHRRDPEFETAEVVAAFDQSTPAELTAIRFLLDTSIGPSDDSEFASAFREHVSHIRNALYTTRLQPLTEQLIGELRADPTLVAPPVLGVQPNTVDRLMINFVLAGAEGSDGDALTEWSRDGVASGKVGR